LPISVFKVITFSGIMLLSAALMRASSCSAAILREVIKVASLGQTIEAISWLAAGEAGAMLALVRLSLDGGKGRLAGLTGYAG